MVRAATAHSEKKAAAVGCGKMNALDGGAEGDRTPDLVTASAVDGDSKSPDSAIVQGISLVSCLCCLWNSLNSLPARNNVLNNFGAGFRLCNTACLP
jgi:hypothetical protein